MKKERHILVMSIPNSPKELAHQMKELITQFYEGCGPEAPMVLGLSWLLAGDGPLHSLAHQLAEKFEVHIDKVGEVISVAIGLTARMCELKRCPMAEPGLEWLKEHNRALSFLAVATQMQERGLGCDCAFCYACMVALKYHKKGDMEQIRAQFNALEDIDRDSSKCAGNIATELAELFNWEKPRTDWGMSEERKDNDNDNENEV